MQVELPNEPPMTPEARRRAALLWREGRGPRIPRPNLTARPFVIARRVIEGTWEDGFIHAGNLAYMTMVALFPFCIAVAAIYSAVGEQGQLDQSITALLQALPLRVREALAPVAHDAVRARHGWLLWVGGMLGVWTATSLVETIRDILYRSYGITKRRAFWRNRLVSSGLIFGAVLLMLLSLSSQVFLSLIEDVLLDLFPRLGRFDYQLAISRLVTAGTLFGSLYTLFYMLTPSRYQGRGFPKWPGAVLVATWWLATAWALPRVLRNFIAYDLTYGSIAGVMIALFFFWFVGLGMVAGAELNAALTVSPEEQEMLAGHQDGNGGFPKGAAENNEAQEEHE
ncbi:YihY/virulence factor BrkB family protein [Novosphingobium sp. BL-8A]|uniref:YihY/virulence factor BrkB family protein n=1 Tax=Novosphingobium sp. BL-8A TaxID=3127639 RepID=UPI0037578A3B